MSSKGGKAKGSGLSLERFIRGKARPTNFKSESAGGKRRRVEKAVLLRTYRKVKEREEPPVKAGGGPSFYDKFFASMQDGDDGDRPAKKAPRDDGEKARKPDPLFKAKRKAQGVRDERQAKRQAIEAKLEEKQSKVVARKKRHVKLSLRTKTGQPVIKHQMKDLLHKLRHSS
ncbi:hypothetical protein SPRG_11455 [Saprolegnia parasitica CBS 223.65]|uniref:rRNA-processing protein FYV7 n=1 Tax=Saprolegnia parasitica (strain CBS 223.65) TaxID=695850 RepID=A0A067BYL5_SAPPC|nr:hypothetical protein SPRG_11455 [Saprolegnia parasitica CBS 223.65]KDO23363.1 hypothetical protein SPRG_11455 [Saprolegnia parasitica CBS 223.65]|eukprot:XP_012205854.1 hypothetical protein SPRG_11455 [Saprolegnia parasitica CBS 223.65]